MNDNNIFSFCVFPLITLKCWSLMWQLIKVALQTYLNIKVGKKVQYMMWMGTVIPTSGFDTNNMSVSRLCMFQLFSTTCYLL